MEKIFDALLTDIITKQYFSLQEKTVTTWDWSQYASVEQSVADKVALQVVQRLLWEQSTKDIIKNKVDKLLTSWTLDDVITACFEKHLLSVDSSWWSNKDHLIARYVNKDLVSWVVAKEMVKHLELKDFY